MIERTKFLNDKSFNYSGKYVFYLMEASQRVPFNYALQLAIEIANDHSLPVLVVFPLTDSFKYSNARYYLFMLQGICELKEQFKALGIKFIIFKGNYTEAAQKFAKDAFCLITDKNYLKTQNSWRKKVAELVEVKVIEIENDVVVPVAIASNKAEVYAAFLRPKIQKNLQFFLKQFYLPEPKIKTVNFDTECWEEKDAWDYLDKLNIDKKITTVEKFFVGGYSNALKLLDLFIEKKLPQYKILRSDPSQDYQSNLSAYIHFGQISTLEILMKVLAQYNINDENVQTLINEMVVWRELARNFVSYCPNYNQYEAIPKWAKQSLEDHVADKREYIYSLENLENANTHDIYWNAAQQEMLKTGKMHNYMRMYWAKKILEWSEHPQQAFDTICYLNDKYFLDGRDPNGYASISWCFGSFDHPWQERKIFGKVRYMNSTGLERKFDIKKYVQKVRNL